jgi:hypothetical protein
LKRELATNLVLATTGTNANGPGGSAESVEPPGFIYSRRDFSMMLDLCQTFSMPLKKTQ